MNEEINVQKWDHRAKMCDPVDFMSSRGPPWSRFYSLHLTIEIY